MNVRSYRTIKTWAGVALAALLLVPQIGFAAPPPKPACGTSGPLEVTAVDPASYSYVQPISGSVGAHFTVSSPDIQVTGNCDSNLPNVFGNGDTGSDVDVTITIGSVYKDDSLYPLDGPSLATFEAAFSAFSPSAFTLTNPGTGYQEVSFTFTNSATIPVGVYDVTISVKPETGVGVGEANTTFTVTVTEPTLVDTLAPEVTIVSPTGNPRLCLGGDLAVSFTAIDPYEGGAGTGVLVVRAGIASTGGAAELDITSALFVSPTLPVAAGDTVNASTDVPGNTLGSFILTAEADDDADHTGSAQASFNVALNVAPLPPISVAGRQFKVGSTLPIKWTLTDCDGLFQSPYSSVRLDVANSGGTVTTYVAGDGAANIRWELDDWGNATQYIANYPITVAGQHTVSVYVDDVDGNPMEQGTFTFFAADKGGKQ